MSTVSQSASSGQLLWWCEYFVLAAYTNQSLSIQNPCPYLLRTKMLIFTIDMLFNIDHPCFYHYFWSRFIPIFRLLKTAFSQEIVCFLKGTVHIKQFWRCWFAQGHISIILDKNVITVIRKKSKLLKKGHFKFYASFNSLGQHVHFFK